MADEPLEVIESPDLDEELSAEDADAVFEKESAETTPIPDDDDALAPVKKADEVVVEEEAVVDPTAEEKAAQEKADTEVAAKAESDKVVAQEKADIAEADADKKAADDAKKAEEDAKKAEEDAAPIPVDDLLAKIIEKHGATELKAADGDDSPAETMASFSEAYPSVSRSQVITAREVAAPLEDRIRALETGIQPVVAAQEATAFEQVKADVFSAITEEHPDGAEIYASPEFREIFDAWPKWKQDVADKVDPSAAKQALDWYKEEKGIEAAPALSAEDQAKVDALKVKQDAAKKKKDNVGKASLRSKKAPKPKPSEDGEIDEDEADRLFDEESKKGN